MNIKKTKTGNELTIALSGRLDTSTAPLLEQELQNCLTGVESLIFDLASLEYISSAGLRVLLYAQKVMSRQGKMTVRGANDMIMEVFDITGFVDILTIE